MLHFLFWSYRRHWLSRWELARLLRTLRRARNPGAEPDGIFDWSTPRWVERSMRRSFYWSLCRLSFEQPLLLGLGSLAALPAVCIVVWRNGSRVALWIGTWVASSGKGVLP